MTEVFVEQPLASPGSAKYKSLLEKSVLYPDKVILRCHPSKLELEAIAGTIVAVTPSSGPNIYITRSIRRSGGICSWHDKRSKIICGVSILCCPAVYITSPSGPAGDLFRLLQSSGEMFHALVSTYAREARLTISKHSQTVLTASDHTTGLAVRTVGQQDRWVE